jgi:hypothetical protein
VLPRPNKNQSPQELWPESQKDKQTERSTLKLLSNSPNKDYWPALDQDPDKAAELTDISYKVNNLNSTQKRSNQERNDYVYNLNHIF